MAMLLEGLNEAQKKAVCYTGGPLLVLAGAGSGKTRVLTHRAAWLIQEKAVQPEAILLLTFTNKAAEEMRSRLVQLVSPDQGHSIKGLFAGTFHSFCVRVLRTNSLALGLAPHFIIFDQDDQKQLIKKITKELNLEGEKFNPSSFLATISSAKNDGLDAQGYEALAKGYWQELVSKVFFLYEQRLIASQALDFDDLLLKTVMLFNSHKGVLAKYQNQYRYVLVDEYQDTNKVQYQLTKYLSAQSRELTAVGDAAQAIYGWRGADYRNLMALQTDYPEMTVVNLEENYRSTQTILTAANAVIAKNVSHPVLSLFTNKQGGDRIVIYEAVSEVDEANFLCQEIQKLGQSGVPFPEIAVLYRTNAQSRGIEEAFIRTNIPYVLIGGVRFYDRTEIKDIIALLRLCLVPGEPVSKERAIKALGKRRFAHFEDYLLTARVQGKASADLLSEVIDNSRYMEKYNPTKEEDYSRMENIKELASVAQAFPNLSEFLENISLVQYEYSEQEKAKKGGGVRLMTIHSAKGLEFKTVFLVGLEEGILPHSRSLFDASQLEEERRLVYVALTRAKDKLYLTTAHKRLIFGHQSFTEVSRFLTDIPERLLERKHSSMVSEFNPNAYSSSGEYPNSFSSKSKPTGFSLADPDLKRLFSDLTYDSNID